MKDIQTLLQSICDKSITEQAERGLQIAVYLDGKLVADVAAGTASPDGPAVDSTTLFPVFSTTKGIQATLAHLLVERGKIGYDTPLAEVWPEFAAHGKGGITLRHALNHTSGLANMPVGLGHAELCDWKTMCALMADEKPVTPAGEEMTYHAITYSWLVGEPLCRVDGRSFPQLIHDEIAVPLGLADEMYAGIPDEAEPRVAVLEDKVDNAAPLMNDATPQAIPPLVQPLFAWMNRADARRACIPASNGIMTARAIARHYAALLPGGVDGVELLPPERVRQATQLQTARISKPEDMITRQLSGYASSAPFPQSFGHGGAGGSSGFANLEHRLAFGFVRNRFVNPDTLTHLVDALKQALER